MNIAVYRTSQRGAMASPLRSTIFRQSNRVIISARNDKVVRIQVSLDEQDYQLARKEAAALEISVAEYARQAVQKARLHSGQPRWMGYAGLVESGDPHSSESID